MAVSSTVIRFPANEEHPPKQKRRRVTNVDGVKYFTGQQIKLLRRTARDQAALDRSKGKIAGVREWMAIDLLTSTGLRVSEAANLRCGDQGWIR